MRSSAQALASGVCAGDVRALARVCRLVDDAVGGYREILQTLFPRTGNAWTIGITGMPGAGKSTLTDQLIAVVGTSDGGFLLGFLQQHFAVAEHLVQRCAQVVAQGG